MRRCGENQEAAESSPFTPLTCGTEGPTRSAQPVLTGIREPAFLGHRVRAVRRNSFGDIVPKNHLG